MFCCDQGFVFYVEIPGGHSHTKKGEDAHWEISIEPVKGTTLGVA